MAVVEERRWTGARITERHSKEARLLPVGSLWKQASHRPEFPESQTKLFILTLTLTVTLKLTLTLTLSLIGQARRSCGQNSEVNQYYLETTFPALILTLLLTLILTLSPTTTLAPPTLILVGR